MARKAPRVALAALVLSLTLVGSRTHAADEEPVVRIGDWTMTAEQVKNEFSYSSPPLLNQVRRSDNSARLLAVEWYSNALIAKAAADDKLLAKMPGLADAAEALRRKMIATRILQQRLDEKFAPTDEELQQFMRLNEQLCMAPARIRVARIGVVVGRNAGEPEAKGAEARIQEVKKRLAAGEPFATLAEQTSDLPVKGEGGDIGWLTAEEVGRTEGGEALLALQKGGVSDVTKTSEGYVIWKLVDREEARPLPFAECKGRLQKVMNEKYRADIAREWIDELAKRYGASMNMDAFVAAIRSVELPADWLEREAAKSAARGEAPRGESGLP
jgi:hypothetical protein